MGEDIKEKGLRGGDMRKSIRCMQQNIPKASGGRPKSALRLKAEALEIGESVDFPFANVKSDNTFRVQVYNWSRATGFKFAVNKNNEEEVYAITRIY